MKIVLMKMIVVPLGQQRENVNVTLSTWLDLLITMVHVGKAAMHADEKLVLHNFFYVVAFLI